MVELRHHSLKETAGWVWGRMARTKKLPSNVMETPLKRCLTTFDITLIGIGHMVGSGIYVVTGTVAKDTAGPAIVLSFLFAGFASVLSALCYAEFGARVPKAGSAYVYTYCSVGEFWAFVIGWNIILEHMIGAASVSRAWSGYVDSLFGGAIGNFTKTHLGNFHESSITSYPDPVAFLVTLIYCALLTIGVKGSSYFNSVFTLVNMIVVFLVIAIGSFVSDIKNWQTPGGFAPFGFSGIIAGAATSFYAFVGFDSIATSGEEALTPRRSIPVATITSMSIVTVGYVLIGAILTLMVPYYEINAAASLPDAFAVNGLYWAKYIISIGALCGMTTSLFGSLFSLPRCVYAMASDGLLFSGLAKVSDTTQVPVLNMILCGFLTAIIALVFDIEKLVEFMSIGTLMAYTIVSASVIILRYRPADSLTIQDPNAKNDSEAATTPRTPMLAEEDAKEKQAIQDTDEENQLRPLFQSVFRFISLEWHQQLVTWAVFVFTLSCISMMSMIQWGSRFLEDPVSAWAVLLMIILMVVMVLSVIVIAAHYQTDNDLAFKVPFVPYLPLISIFFNISLMVHLNPMTWIRFAVWMTIGLVLYFCYGIHKSKEEEPVSSFSTLLPETDKIGSNVFGTVQQKIRQVTSKIISAANNSSLVADGRKDDTTNFLEKDSITEKEPQEEEG